jgi:hypothetical protein
VDLTGPRSTTSQPVTYFIFGSDTDFGDRSMVPLQAERMDEQSFGPLAMGDQLLDIDLSPWDGYAHLYLRAIPTQPNLIVKLEPGKLYEFSSS